MYLNIVFLPLIGSTFSSAFGRFLGPYGASFLTTFCILFSLLLSFFAFYEVGFFFSPCYIKLLT